MVEDHKQRGKSKKRKQQEGRRDMEDGIEDGFTHSIRGVTGKEKVDEGRRRERKRARDVYINPPRSLLNLIPASKRVLKSSKSLGFSRN